MKVLKVSIRSETYPALDEDRIFKFSTQEDAEQAQDLLQWMSEGEDVFTTTSSIEDEE